jgi:hypothetical protein
MMNFDNTSQDWLALLTLLVKTSQMFLSLEALQISSLEMGNGQNMITL